MKDNRKKYWKSVEEFERDKGLGDKNE